MVHTQVSYSNERKGCLYLVPTPIGNLQDMTFRAIETLKRVDYIAAEDTRQTKKLLNYFDIQQTLISYHEHNKRQRGEKIIQDLREGKQIALVTDAGMPGISDPGTDLVQQAVDEALSVVALPGPNAALTALIASGLDTDQFFFIGFLDRNKKKKQEQLQEIKRLPYTTILYESPHRITETIRSMVEILGGERKLSLVREISKKHEEYIRGELADIHTYIQANQLRGEICIILEGGDAELQEEETSSVWWESYSLQEHVQYYIDQQEQTAKDAIKRVAKERGLPKRQVYQAYHIDEDS